MEEISSLISDMLLKAVHQAASSMYDPFDTNWSKITHN